MPQPQLVNYTGWKKWSPTADEMTAFEVDGRLPFELLENEYLIICEDKELKKPVQQYCYEKGQLRRVSYGSIKVPRIKIPESGSNEGASAEDLKSAKNDGKSLRKGAKKRSTNKYSNKEEIIYPRNIEQVCAIDLMQDDSKTIKLITGSWGTGKTMLLVTSALQRLHNGKAKRIVWIRNNVDVKGTKDLGALPGDIVQKLYGFLGPFIDYVGKPGVKARLENGSLEVEPLQSLRGRNFKDSIIMCSEAENLMAENIQLIIARAAEGSYCFFDADNRQRDKIDFEKSRGIERLIESLAGEPLFGYVHLMKSERSATASLADKIR